MGRSRKPNTRFVPLPLANNPINIQPVAIRPPRSYSQAVTSSQASLPPLTAPPKTAQPAMPIAMEGTNKRKTQLGKGEPKGSGPSQRLTLNSLGKPSPNSESRVSSDSRRIKVNPQVTIPTEVMNEHLTERFGYRSSFQQGKTPATDGTLSQLTLVTNQAIRNYVKASNKPFHLSHLSHWTGYPEVPSAEEVNDSENENIREPIPIPANIVVGPYESREDYLERQYTLLREDAVAPLRAVISEVQEYPRLEEKDSDCSAYIYEKVFITGFTFSSSGVAARITFSLRRVGKKVNWEQSKRLLTGCIVALTPVSDMFKNCCHVATVAARPLAGLEQNPPQIDIFFGSPDEIEIDPQQEWLMVESRNGFYEGYRHTLEGLQMLAKEEFPLSGHIVDIEREVKPPTYIEVQPQKDLSSLFPTVNQDVRNVNILTGWPDLPSQLDTSQMDALKRILLKRLAIVQGPPGTGKTFVSVTAIRVLLENMTQDDPPILVAAHTNHALDQILRHISSFEPKFIRLGGWTKDIDAIKPRTLYEVKSATRYSNPVGGLRGPALTRVKQLANEMKSLLQPLMQDEEPLSADLFHEYGIISDAQYESLVNGSKEWVRAGTDADIKGDIAIWLGDELVEAKQRTLPEDFGIEVEEADLEYEQLKELEAESKLVGDEDADTLRGPRIVFYEPYTGRKTIGVTGEAVQTEMKKQDLWTVPTEYRGPAYRYMQSKAKVLMRTKLRIIAHQYAKASQEAKIGGWEIDYNFLKEARVIGATTTGVSKYRALLQAMNPKVVMIEEAAETLEAPIAVACFKTLEHLILVGDHQQLRAHCNEEELAGKPFYLGVSMMERLIRNKVEFSQLRRQRRMIPEIRRGLLPIYDDLEDHPAVLQQPPVPGVGVNSFFFSHNGNWRETRDNQMSATNVGEADMIVAFFIYLVQNGTRPSEITVLTFYNGQRKLILRKLRQHRQLSQGYYKVVTVDSYQGEENRCVLLSLVRSNEDGKIGFLEVENRVCVALSRAQSGFYIFGDAPALCKSSMLWWQVVKVMGRDPQRVGFHLPLTCQKHARKGFIKDPYELLSLDGGCTQPCQDQLNCGHFCELRCHPFSHDQVTCYRNCSRLLECAHPCCTELCHSDSDCKSSCEYCAKDELAKGTASLIEENERARGSISSPLTTQKQPHTTSEHDGFPLRQIHNQSQISLAQQQQDSQHFRHYAAGGHVDSDMNLALLAKREQEEAERKRLDDENFAALFGDPRAPALTERKDNVNIVRTKSDGKGGSRSVWKGTFEIPKAKTTDSRKEEGSLLDLI